jgi:hypothetical protein
MSLGEINYSGQYLDNREFRLKVRTGGDIYNAAENAVAGEMFLVTGAQSALYIAKSTSTVTSGIADHEIYKLKDLTEKIENINLLSFPGGLGDA